MPRITLADINQDEWQLILKAIGELAQSKINIEAKKASALLQRTSQSQPVVFDEVSKEELLELIRLLDFYQVYRSDNVKHFWDPKIPAIERKLNKWFQRAFRGN